MEEMKLKGAYDGVVTTKLGIATIKFKFPYSEITKYIKVLSLIGIDLSLIVKFEKTTEIKLGECRVKKLQVDREGEATLWLESERMDQSQILSIVERTVIVKLVETGDK